MDGFVLEEAKATKATGIWATPGQPEWFENSGFADLRTAGRESAVMAMCETSDLISQTLSFVNQDPMIEPPGAKETAPMEYRERCIATGDGIAFQDEPDTSTNLHIGPDQAQPALI